MAGVVLCDYAGDDEAARQFVLDRAALLQLEGGAELVFIGHEGGRAMAALTMPAWRAATDIAEVWRTDAAFPASMALRVLQLEAPANGVKAAFP